jgi:hypothetical protein
MVNIHGVREYNTQRAGNVVTNILGRARSAGANITRQQQWARMTEMQRNMMRRKYKDSDHDGVPDLWDCQRRNSFRQEEIDDDEAYAQEQERLMKIKKERNEMETETFREMERKKAEARYNNRR